MTTVNTSVVIAVFLLILVISMVTAIIISPENFERSRWRIFLVTAASLGIIITFMWYFFLVEQNVENKKITTCNERRHIESLVIDASVKSIQTNSELAPQFCSSLFPLQESYVYEEHEPKCSRYKKSVIVSTLSYQLFDTWDHYVYSTFQPKGDIAYFLQWATSKELQHQWTKQYINFDKNTQKFANILFNSANEIDNISDPVEYEKASREVYSKCRKMKLLCCSVS